MIIKLRLKAVCIILHHANIRLLILVIIRMNHHYY